MIDKEVFASFLECFLILFTFIDIIGSTPIIIDLRKRFGKIEAGKASIVAGLILISFLFAGNKILSLINLDMNSFALAGAFIIFIIALEMILGIEIHKSEEMTSASIIPIAFPLVAGAGTLTTTISLSAKHPIMNIVLAIIVNMLIVYICLRSSDFLSKYIKGGVLMILKKAFGIILLAMSIKMFLENLLPLIKKLSQVTAS